MSSTIKVNNIQNLAGDDSGIDLSTNDQIILKTANTTALTVDSSQNVTLAGNLTVTGTATGTSIGDNQSWTNVTSSRANNTTYTNSTGTSIQVMVSSNLSANERMQTFIAGTQVADNGISTVYGGMAYSSFIVPNGITYKINMVVGSIVYWWELR